MIHRVWVNSDVYWDFQDYLLALDEWAKAISHYGDAEIYQLTIEEARSEINRLLTWRLKFKTLPHKIETQYILQSDVYCDYVRGLLK